MLYLTASAWDEAVKKEQLKVKEIEDKYNGKILEHGVRNQRSPAVTDVNDALSALP